MLRTGLLRSRLVKLMDNHPADDGPDNGRAQIRPTALRLCWAVRSRLAGRVVIPLAMALPPRTICSTTGLVVTTRLLVATNILYIDQIVKDRGLESHVKNRR